MSVYVPLFPSIHKFDCYIANTEAELDQGLCDCGSALQVRSNLRGFCVKQFSRKTHSQNPIAAELCQNIKHGHGLGLPTEQRYTQSAVTKAVTKWPKSCLLVVLGCPKGVFQSNKIHKEAIYHYCGYEVTCFIAAWGLYSVE